MKVLNLKRLGGVLPPGAVYIGRAAPHLGLPASPYANRFRIKSYADPAERDSACDSYEADLRERMARDPTIGQRLMDDLWGRDLVCYCAPARCHGHTLVRICEELHHQGLLPASLSGTAPVSAP